MYNLLSNVTLSHGIADLLLQNILIYKTNAKIKLLNQKIFLKYIFYFS